jgi:hypothetical protein
VAEGLDVVVEGVVVVVEGVVVVVEGVDDLVPVTELYASDVAFLVECHQEFQKPPFIVL